MILTALPILAEQVYALTPVPFIDENGDTQTVTDYHTMDAARWNHQIYGMNVVVGNVTISEDRQEVDGVAHIIIPDGCSLTIKKGITVAPGNTLYIYGQSGGTGKLIVNENKKDKCAGIGGDNNGSCGTIVINSGTVIAYGGSDAAGIGGGNEPKDGYTASSITINGGKVYAYGGKYGAGIGGGDLSAAGTITINGGQVYAEGGSDAAGIGSGDEAKDGNTSGKIIINGGKVDAYGGKYGAGIGGGDFSDGGTITINKGTVYAKGGQEAAAIGGGDGDGTKYGNGGTITINGGNVTAESFEHEAMIDEQLQDQCLGAGIGGGTEGGAGTITITGGKVQATGHRGGAGIGSGCDVNEKSNKSLIGGTITISGGEVHGYTPEPDNPGIRAYGGGAGIGSGRNSPGCDITISGGKVYGTGSNYKYLKGKDGGAGIGNSQHSSGGSVTITGGTIEAYSSCAKPIGQGANGSAPACTLDYPDCKVWWLQWDYHGESTTIISSENDRSTKAFGNAGNDNTLHIEPCDHPNLEYQSDGTSHSTHCVNCGKDIQENHTWKYVNKGKKHQEVCKVCGYEGKLYDHEFERVGDKCVCGAQGIRISFDANGGSGEMTDVIIRKGDDYILPECGFTEPEGREFMGWKVSIYQSGVTYPPGHSVSIPEEAFTLTAQWGDNWHTIQTLIDGAQDGDTIILAKDYTAGPDDVEFLIDSGKNITIDLNSHTIDRALDESSDPEAQGSVFKVKGSLTVTDSSSAKKGVIKGGKPISTDGSSLYDAGGAFTVDGGTLTIKAGNVKESTGTAGAVWLGNGAAFNFEGGTISYTEGLSATVMISGGSTLNMSGGSIMDNDIKKTEAFSETSPAGAVIIDNGSFSVSGAPFIQRNSDKSGSGTVIRNVWLAEGQTITVAGTLRQTAKIGVSVEDEPATTEETRVLTSGLPDKGRISAFVSDKDNYKIRRNSAKEAILSMIVDIPVESIEVEPSEITLEIGEEISLNAIITPEDAVEQDVLWVTDDYTIATVEPTTGKMTALALGKTTITAYAVDDTNITAECAVEVVDHKHDWIEATCTEPKTCSKCGETEGEALGHDYQEVDGSAVASTCTNPGKDADLECTRCHDVIEGDETAALGHDWGAPVYTWADDNSSVSAKRVCARDGSHVEEETVGTTSEVSKPASCTEKGQTAYITEAFTNEAFEEQIKRLDNIDALDHDYQPVESSAVAPTCTDPGHEADQKCTRCDDVIEGDEIAARGHKWGEWKKVSDPTETTEGSQKRACSRCGEEETRIIPVTGHEHGLSKVEAAAPTCTEDGNIEYWICDRGDSPCRRYFADEDGNTEINIEDTVVKATGHAWGEWTVTADATCMKEGEEQRVCANDASHVQTRETPADPDAHSWDEGTVTTEPTCTSEGVKTFRCNNRHAHITVESVSALGHDWGEWEVTKQPTATVKGEKQRVCKRDPSHIEKESIPALISGTLISTMKAKGSTSLVISWNKVNGAEGYDIFFVKCNKNNSCKLVKTIKGNKTLTWTKKGLKKNTAYKAYVKAWVMKDGKKSYAEPSPTVYAYSSGYTKKYTNPKSVTVKKTKVSLKKGKTYAIKASVSKLKSGKTLMPKSYAAKLRYLSSNKSVTTVNKSGKITAKGKGTCYVYVYATNGVYKKVKVTVN